MCYKCDRRRMPTICDDFKVKVKEMYADKVKEEISSALKAIDKLTDWEICGLFKRLDRVGISPELILIKPPLHVTSDVGEYEAISK